MSAREPVCHEEVCLTCSDEAVPVTVLRLLEDGMAEVDTGQGREEVSVALVEARAGDTVLVHAKEAIAVVADAVAEDVVAEDPVAEEVTT
ncbi:HypC/HybG/HupF family hydrogenase formation chaperone [Nonomuraea dietziae]|uniref:HypC/HybG/HupF family hydrogenase formation chaperone n=1 Tax=Nonomuraea dietziae TaxID=65515 RepID=UPI0034478194